MKSLVVATGRPFRPTTISPKRMPLSAAGLPGMALSTSTPSAFGRPSERASGSSRVSMLMPSQPLFASLGELPSLTGSLTSRPSGCPARSAGWWSWCPGGRVLARSDAPALVLPAPLLGLCIRLAACFCIGLGLAASFGLGGSARLILAAPFHIEPGLALGRVGLPSGRRCSASRLPAGRLASTSHAPAQMCFGPGRLPAHVLVAAVGAARDRRARQPPRPAICACAVVAAPGGRRPCGSADVGPLTGLRAFDGSGSRFACGRSSSSIGRSCATDRGRSECRTLRQASMAARKPGR